MICSQPGCPLKATRCLQWDSNATVAGLCLKVFCREHFELYLVGPVYRYTIDCLYQEDQIKAETKRDLEEEQRLRAMRRRATPIGARRREPLYRR